MLNFELFMVEKTNVYHLPLGYALKMQDKKTAVVHLLHRGGS